MQDYCKAKIPKNWNHIWPSTRQRACFMCSNLKSAGIKYTGNNFQGEYFGCFDKHNDHLEQLTAHLKNNTKRPVAGILGPNMQAKQVMNTLGLSNACFSFNNNDGLYKKDLPHCPVPLMPENSVVVLARDVPKTLLRFWMEGYEVEALKAPKDHQLPYRVEAKLERLVQNDCWVLMVSNTCVSLVGFNACLENTVQVGPVWTPLEHRGQGFARLLLSYVLAQEAQKGIQKAILFTGDSAAVRVYAHVGFQKIGHYRVALLKEPIYVFPDLEFTPSLIVAESMY